jgi:hypothetical protein
VCHLSRFNEGLITFVSNLERPKLRKVYTFLIVDHVSRPTCRYS